MALDPLVPNRELIISLLRESGQTISNDVDFSFSRIGEGKGFASLLYKTLVGETSYAIKITDPRVKLKGFEDLNIHGIMHNREVDFYKWASQCPQSALSQFKMPKYYGGRYCDGCEERACSRNFVTHFIQEGILILEDFTHRMIGEIDFLGGFSLDLVIDSHLFQRCVYFPVKDIIRSIVGYQNVYLSAVEKFSAPDTKVLFATLMRIAETSIDALSVKSWINEETKIQLHSIAKNVNKFQEQCPDYVKNCPRTLIHSDLWPNNMLYERKGDDYRLLAIVDWQCYTIDLFRTANGVSGGASTHYSSLHHPMSVATCVFTVLEPSVDLPKELIYECGGTNSILSSLLHFEQPAHGTVHAVDAMLMRGGIFIDWTDKAKATEVLTMSVCSSHQKNLLVDWKKHPYGNKYTHRKVLTCSLPENSTARPSTDKRLNKEDTLAFIGSTGKFCMVGTGVCSKHQKAIRERNWATILFEKDPLEEDIDDNGNDLTNQFGDEEISDVEDNASIFTLSGEMDESDTEMVTKTVHTEKSAVQEKTDAVRALCVLYGISRLSSERKWDELRPDTQRKKISVMLNLQDELYKVCAGNSWRSMKETCLRKMATVEKDSRVESIMDAVGQCLEDCTDKSVRISVVKLLTGLFTEKEIRSGTGASRYIIRQAKLSSFEEVRMLKKFRRERPEIIITLPNSGKNLTLTNGDDVSIATVARLYSYREIYSLFGQYCEELGRLNGLDSSSDIAEFVRSKALGFSTAYKLMKVLSPNRQLRQTCVDAYQADAYDASFAFDELSRIVDELSLLNEIDLERTMELRRRIRVAKNFLFGEMRSHISKESTVVNHCWTYALNDGNDSRFASPCNHTHDTSCTECSQAMSLPTIVKKIVELPHAIADRNANPIRHRLGRMMDICIESQGLIQSYRQHLIRCVASEYDRRKIIDSLEDGHAFIVADYAMKLLPTNSIEKQSQWFAKAGISFHMSAAIARINGELVSHSFSHVSSVSKQDSLAVAGILYHVFSILKLNGVMHIHLRTDNAGNYHNVALVAFLLQIADDLDLNVISHIFSEAQYGKGRADREISLCKGKLNTFIDSGHPATTPEEILTGFTHNILLKGCSFYLIEVAEVEGSRAVINGIKIYSSFRFERGVGIRVRKHDSIGDGMIVDKDELSPLKLTTTIHKECGYLSHSDHFWKIMGKANYSVDDEVKENEPISEEGGGVKDYLRCPDMLCQSRFKTQKGMELHLERGNHSYLKESQTVKDYAARKFSNLIESTEEAQAAVHEDSLIPLSNSSAEEKKNGWALKKKEKNVSLDKEVKDEVERMVREKLDGDRRAEAKEIKDQLRDLKMQDGSYRFALNECLSESQVKSQITRILNLKKKEKEIEENGQPMQKTTVPKAGGRKRKEPASSKESQKRKIGRPSKKAIETMEEDLDDDSDKEDYPEEESVEEINSLEIMEQVVKENLNVIFSNEDSDEYEEEL